MTYLHRVTILRILQHIHENGGRLERHRITRTLLHSFYPASVIDLALKMDLKNLVSTEVVKRKGVCRPTEFWTIAEGGYRMLGATPPSEKPQSAPVAPAEPAATLPRIKVWKLKGWNYLVKVEDGNIFEPWMGVAEVVGEREL